MLFAQELVSGPRSPPQEKPATTPSPNNSRFHLSLFAKGASVARTFRLMYASAAALAYTLLIPSSVSAQQAAAAPATSTTALAASPAPAAAQTIPGAPAPSPGKLPLPNRVNQNLPSWLRLR